MAFAGVASMIAIKIMAVTFKNIYATACAITVDSKYSYAASQNHMACMLIQHGDKLFLLFYLLMHLLACQMHCLDSLARQLHLLIPHPASRIMVIADGISMMYLQIMAFANGNIYATSCAITVDDKTTYTASLMI